MQLGGDTKTKDDIAKYGCTVMHVMEEGESPPFAYSIGITQETGAPEIVVIGLKQPMAHFIVNEYNHRVKSGEKIEVGEFYSEFIEDFEVFVEDVPLSAYDDYFGQAIDFYGGRAFKVIQIIYPTTKSIWPWTEDAPKSYQVWQPVLAKVGRA
jgi:hypothetical protein